VEKVKNLNLWQSPTFVMRLMVFDRLYHLINEVQGSIYLFGLKWGRDMVLFQILRSILDVHNPYRHIVGFDTFSGHVGTDPERDGDEDLVQPGSFSVSADTAEWLTELVKIHFDHVGGGLVQIMPGDVRLTVPARLATNSHELVALAYFDMDLYEPTRKALEAILPRMPKGGVIAFDELNSALYPGETKAMLDVLGRVEVRRFPYLEQSYVIV
jgi:hypothetical protein